MFKICFKGPPGLYDYKSFQFTPQDLVHCQPWQGMTQRGWRSQQIPDELGNCNNQVYYYSKSLLLSQLLSLFSIVIIITSMIVIIILLRKVST